MRSRAKVIFQVKAQGTREASGIQRWGQSERTLRLLHSVVDCLYSFRVEGGEVVTTQHEGACVPVTGYTTAELQAHPHFFWRRVLFEEDRPAVMARCEQALEEDAPQTIEHRIVQKGGLVRWVENTVVPCRDDRGVLSGGDGVVRDVTDRKHAKQLLELQNLATQALCQARTIQEGVQRMLNSASKIFRQLLWDAAIFWTPDDQTGVLRCKGAWCSTALDGEFHEFANRKTYRAGEGLPGKAWATATPCLGSGTGDRDRPEDSRLLGLQEACAFPVLAELRVLGVLQLFTRRAQTPAPDVIQGLVALATQLGHFMIRQNAQEALAREGNLLRTIMDALPVLVYVKDCQSRFVLNNQAHISVLGASTPEDVLGRTDMDFFPPDLASAYRRDEENVLESGLPLLEREEPVVTAHGKRLWALTSKVPMRDPQGNILGIVGVTRDITDRKEAEESLKRAYEKLEKSQEALQQTLKELELSNKELHSTQLQLIHAAKLESVGALAAAVAHEVKNPLQTILMGVEYLERNLGAPDPEAPGVLHDVHDAVERSKAILGDLLEISSSTPLQMKEEDPNGIVERSLRLVRFDLVRTHINVVTDLNTDIPKLKFDRGKIEQVFLNLFVNAMQAMPLGGTLFVSSRRAVLEEQMAWPECRSAGFAPGEEVVIVEVRDTGTGIPEANLNKVFDTFFTTKAPGVGTGLGLSIVKKIIKMHRGAVHIENVRPHGAKVSLILRGG